MGIIEESALLYQHLDYKEIQLRRRTFWHVYAVAVCVQPVVP